MPEPIVMIVDADSLSCNAMAAQIEPLNLASESYPSAAEFHSKCDTSRNGCLLLNVKLSDTSGFEVQQILIENQATLPIIFLADDGIVADAVRVMKLGAVDYIEQPFTPERLAESIHKGLELSESAWRTRTHREDLANRISQFTVEERLVMKQILAGKTNSCISDSMEVSLRTVQSRRSSIMKKLNVDSWLSLMQLITRHGELIKETIYKKHH